MVGVGPVPARAQVGPSRGGARGEADATPAVLEKIRAASSTISVPQVLVDLSTWDPRVAGADNDSRSPVSPGQREASSYRRPNLTFVEQGAFAWRGALRWDSGDESFFRSLLEENLSSIDRWEVGQDLPRIEADNDKIRSVLKDYPGVKFGAWADATGQYPDWADFKVFPFEGGSVGEAVVAGPDDWAVVTLPKNLSRGERTTMIGRLAFELVRRGFQNVFIDTSWQEFAEPVVLRDTLNDTSRLPNPYLFGWLGTSRLLNALVFSKAYQVA